jgi:hypothetical protein
MDDALLVLQAGLTPAERQACLDVVRAQAALTATMGPRICEVRGPTAARVGLRALRGVVCVIGREAADAERAAAEEREYLERMQAQNGGQGPA